MNGENVHIDVELIGKYLSGETDQGESNSVEAWIGASDENRKEFLRLKKLWESSEPEFNVIPADVNTDKAWVKLKDRISEDLPASTDIQEYEDSRKTGHSIFYYAVRIAAMLAFAALGYVLIFRPFSGRQKIEMVAVNKVETQVLSDSSRITLNVNSNITYPEKFKSGSREVRLSGEAFFEVKHMKDKPFIVRMKDANVQVLGTEFNVRDIAIEPEVTVTVTEGRVKFSDKDDILYVYLGPDEKGVLHRDSGLIEKYKASDENELFWKTRTLLFRSTRLSIVFNTLEKIFKVSIHVENDNILNCTLTGKFTDASAEEILNKISLSFNLNIQKNNNDFTISGDGCEIH